MCYMVSKTLSPKILVPRGHTQSCHGEVGIGCDNGDWTPCLLRGYLTGSANMGNRLIRSGFRQGRPKTRNHAWESCHKRRTWPFSLAPNLTTGGDLLRDKYDMDSFVVFVVVVCCTTVVVMSMVPRQICRRRCRPSGDCFGSSWMECELSLETCNITAI